MIKSPLQTLSAAPVMSSSNSSSRFHSSHHDDHRISPRFSLPRCREGRFGTRTISMDHAPRLVMRRSSTLPTQDLKKLLLVNKKKTSTKLQEVSNDDASCRSRADSESAVTVVTCSTSSSSTSSSSSFCYPRALHDSLLFPTLSGARNSMTALEAAIAPSNYTLSSAVIKIQRVMRGTLTRWHVRILKLQAKLARIEAAKKKQLLQVEERKQQQLCSVRAELELCQELVVERRRSKRTSWVRHHLESSISEAKSEYLKLKHQCKVLAKHNDASAQILQQFISNMEMAQRDVACLKATHQHWQNVCWTYQTILHVFVDHVYGEESDVEDEEEYDDEEDWEAEAEDNDQD